MILVPSKVTQIIKSDKLIRACMQGDSRVVSLRSTIIIVVVIVNVLYTVRYEFQDKQIVLGDMSKHCENNLIITLIDFCNSEGLTNQETDPYTGGRETAN